jgi:hypothetical protein
MKYDLLISDEAFFDIEYALHYYAFLPVENLETRFWQQLKDGMDYITKHPKTLAVKYREIRIYNLPNFPYQIHYLLHEKTVSVVGVFHGSSDPNSWEERL